MSSAPKYRFDQYEADVNAAELRRGETRLKLQLQPFQVLVALLERPREVLSREELRQRLWPEDTFVDFDHGLNTAMAKLRDVLGDSASNPRYIETIAKRGYRFLGNVTAVQEPARRAAAAATTEAATTPAVRPAVPESADSELPRASRRTARTLFTLSQTMYVIFYLCALFRLDRLDDSAHVAWGRAG